MDETPEEMDQIRKDAALIDPYKYRKRSRGLAAVAIGGVAAAAVYLGANMWSQSRNPCERLSKYYCGRPDVAVCKTWSGILSESVDDPSPKMRSLVRQQCETKIARLKEEDGVTVQ